MVCFNQRRQGYFIAIRLSFPHQILKVTNSPSFLSPPFCAVQYVDVLPSKVVLSQKYYCEAVGCLLLNGLLCICPLTFITEALHLVATVKTIPIHFIDGKCHIKQLKSGKSRKICLTNHT